MPRRNTPALRVRSNPTPAPAPQHIQDKDYVQGDRTVFGRSTWYNPKAIRPLLAAMIRRSPFYAGLSPEELRWTETCLNDWEGPSEFRSDLDIRTEKSWGVGVDISFNFRSAGERERVEDPETGGYFFVMQQVFNVKVNWSSTGRNLTTAQASIALYQEAVNLGCAINAKAEEYDGRIAVVYKMIPNPAYVAPETTEATM